jgi:hypothetical protein
MKRSDITDEQVIEACKARMRGDALDAVSYLMDKTGAPCKVVCAAMERSYDRGLIEVGVSLRMAWPKVSTVS